jgi:hypothetical protein
MSTNSSGLYYTQTVGWMHVSATTFWVLFPGTLVALITISVVLFSVARDTAGDTVRAPFDPTNAMHLLAASAAGGLHDVFTGTEEKDIEAARDVKVVLESIPGRGPALIRSTL